MTIARYEDERLRLSDYGAVARAGVFLAVFTLALLTLRPFADLREELSDEPIVGRDALTYFAFFALAAVGFTLARRYASPAFAALAKSPFVALAGWIAFSALISYDPATSLKRAALCLLVSASAAMAPLLPRGRSEMAQLVTIAAAIPLALSYLGVLLAPDLAIHSAADAAEPDLAGAWRGVFAHKNIASPAVGLFAYVGFYLVSEGRRWQGLALAGASIVFLLFTNGKSSTAMWLPALLVGFYGARTSRRLLFAALALGPAIAISALGFGAQMFEPLKNLATLLPFDSTFTGRADVWRVAAEKIPERLVLGRGFDAFWDDPSLRSNAENGWTMSGGARAQRLCRCDARDGAHRPCADAVGAGVAAARRHPRRAPSAAATSH